MLDLWSESTIPLHMTLNPGCPARRGDAWERIKMAVSGAAFLRERARERMRGDLAQLPPSTATQMWEPRVGTKSCWREATKWGQPTWCTPWVLLQKPRLLISCC